MEADRKGRQQNVVSDLQIVQDEANVEGAQGKLDGAYATLKNAELNLSFTQVKAQISGQISRFYYTPGNLITQDQTLLTTIVAKDRMYAYFDVEERIFARVIKEISSNKNFSPIPVESSGRPGCRRRHERSYASSDGEFPRSHGD